MKASLTLVIFLIFGSTFMSCTPQEIIDRDELDNPAQIVSTGDDDDIGPDNDKDE